MRKTNCFLALLCNPPLPLQTQLTLSLCSPLPKLGCKEIVKSQNEEDVQNPVTLLASREFFEVGDLSNENVFIG